eukprot:gene24269-29477_t
MGIPSIQNKLSEYELQRLENIRKNNAVMEKLGLFGARDSLVANLQVPTPKPKQIQLNFSRKRKQADPESLRRSSRKAGKPVAYTPDALDEVVANAERPKRRRCEGSLANAQRITQGLSDQQRASLDGAQSWLDDMEEFLLHTPHGRGYKTISEDNCRTVMRQVRVLVSGTGITYRHWPDNVIFGENQPVTLSSDFVQLYGEAAQFENKYGEDRGHGWLLRHPITKLLCYQLHRHDAVAK